MRERTNDLKLRRRRIRAALVLGNRGADEILTRLSSSGVSHTAVVGSKPYALAEALETLPPDEEFVFVDASACAGGWLDDLLSDTRANVVVVQPRLAHQMRAGDTHFALEPVDVPWYSRRVVTIATDLVPHRSHGEVICSGIIGGCALAALRGLAASNPAAHLTELLSLLIEEGHDFYAHAVPAVAWELAEPAHAQAAV